MANPRWARRSLTMLVAFVGSVVGCRDRPREPAIGFTYSWSDRGLVAFLEREVARRTPTGATRVRIAVGPSDDWRTLGSTMLAAEVNRAIALADDPDVVVVVGPGGSREVLQVAPIYRRAGLAHLAPTATSRSLAGAGEWTFLMAPNDSLQGEFIGAFADTALRARRAAILYTPDEYGIGLAAGTEASLASRGIALLDHVPVRPNVDCLVVEGADAYRAIVAQLALRGTPDVVIAATRAMETACLLRPLRARWPGVHLLAGDGTYVDSSFFLRSGDVSGASYFVAFWHPTPQDTASMSFARGFREATGRSARHGDAVFFDALMLAVAAVREAGTDRHLVREYLATLGSRRPAFEGIAGPVAFTGDARRRMLMTRVVRGEVRVAGAP